MRRVTVAVFAILTAAGCSSTTYVTAPAALTPPANLTYELVPSGDPANPVGILLRWDPTTDPNVMAYRVYSSATVGGAWALRATTTSASFSDLGVPDLQYTVTTIDAAGNESATSNVITVNAANQLTAPNGLVTISLNTAVQLSWLPNARTAAPSLFSYYRVYSTPYNVAQNLCTNAWVIEGTTVSEDFISSGLPNGVPLCFAVSAISVDGHESPWSTPASATPRLDARNVAIYAQQQNSAMSGFIFYDPTTQLYGEVTSGARADLDFRVDRHADGSLWLTPIRSGTSVFALGPIADVTSIGYAPTSGYTTAAVPTSIGAGFTFTTQLTDGVHFGGLRVTAITANYLIVDWSYQTDPNDPQLLRLHP